MEVIWLFGYTDPVTADNVDAVFGLNVVANNNIIIDRGKNVGDHIAKTMTKYSFDDFLL